MRFRYDPKALTRRDPAVVVTSLPAGRSWTRSIALARTAGSMSELGSSCDICREAVAAGLGRALRGDGSARRLFATGLRKQVGLAFHPRTRVLWTTVNERDWRRGGAPPDYVTEVRQGSAYGWPDCYAERGVFVGDPELRDRRECQGLALPTLELPPHSAPLGLTFYSGTAFPARYRESLFVALHGSRAELPAAGYKVVRVAFRAGRPGQIEDFATGWRTDSRVWGRPVDIVTGRDGALYVSDDRGQDRRIRIPTLEDDKGHLGGTRPTTAAQRTVKYDPGCLRAPPRSWPFSSR